MNILFHSNQLCVRGTTTAFTEYARYCKNVWGYNVRITYDKNCQWNRQNAIESITSEFGADNILCYDRFDEVNEYIKNNNINFCYIVKGGELDGKYPQGCKVGVHAVFRNYQPHGDVYAYISKWLSDIMSQGKSPYVDYPISIAKPNGNLREELGIPESVFVFGRHGGEDQFDIPWVHQVIWQIVNQNPHIYFIFMNTNRFCPDHSQIKHLPSTTDMQRKANFINTCDAGLNARQMGESFGMSNCEFMALDKPVFACTMGGDRNHIEMINDEMYLYNDPNDFVNKLNRYMGGRIIEQPGYFASKVAKYEISNIMENQFKPVFLGV